MLKRAYGASSFSEAASVDTTAGGAWSDTATPSILTRHQAQFGNATSRVVTVKVRPKIVLALVSRTARRGMFKVTVNGTSSLEPTRPRRSASARRNGACGCVL